MQRNVAQVHCNEAIAKIGASLFILDKVSEAKHAVGQNQERAVVEHFKCMRLFCLKWLALQCVDSGS